MYNKDGYEAWEIESANWTLYYAMLSIIKLIAPIMPHITEEIYHLYFDKIEGYKSIHISPWPKYDVSLKDKKAESIGDVAIDVIAAIRKFKAENSLSVAHPLNYVVIGSPKVKSLLREIEKTLKINHIKIGKPKRKDIESEKFKIALEINK
jgi:valyl-tRNA synthetase